MGGEIRVLIGKNSLWAVGGTCTFFLCFVSVLLAVLFFTINWGFEVFNLICVFLALASLLATTASFSCFSSLLNRKGGKSHKDTGLLPLILIYILFIFYVFRLQWTFKDFSYHFNTWEGSGFWCEIAGSNLWAAVGVSVLTISNLFLSFLKLLLEVVLYFICFASLLFSWESF